MGPVLTALQSRAGCAIDFTKDPAPTALRAPIENPHQIREQQDLPYTEFVGEDLKRAWLAHYGAPLYGESMLSGRPAPDLEKLVVDALALGRRDPSLTRALPVLLWRRRGDLDMAKLRRLAQAKRRERTLGFFLDLAGRLSGDRRLRSAAAALRPSSPRPPTNFFTNHQGPLARTLADKNTPPVARSWGYRMNMGMDAFESMFAKAKATPREALLAS
jgi:hypothetical protein